MLGNLSKVLIKAPGFFNNQKDNTLRKIPEENYLDPFNQINQIKNKDKSLNKIYYKEKDYWRKNFMLDMNFNHNKRLLHKLNLSGMHNKTNEYEKGAKDLSKNNGENKDINYLSKIRQNPSLSMNNPIKTIRREKNLNIYKNIFLLNNNNFNDTEINLGTDSSKMDNKNKKFLYTESNNNKKHRSIINQRYNTEENYDTILNKEKNEFIKNKEKYKFPKKMKAIRSQEKLFQDIIDQKFISLISVKPKIKEQLKSINRSMVGQRDFYVYQKSGRFNSPNPFYESMKRKEEMNKLLK